MRTLKIAGSAIQEQADPVLHSMFVLSMILKLLFVVLGSIKIGITSHMHERIRNGCELVR